MRVRAVIVIAVSLSLTGCGPDDPVHVVRSHQAPIVNGVVDNDHPFVGAITISGGICTATLVGVRTVLTAAHCVTPGRQHIFHLVGTTWAVEGVARHPQFDWSQNKYDIGVARLKSAPPVPSTFISTKPPSVGQVLTLVGYGETGNGGGTGTKRVAKNTVAAITDDLIVINGSGGEIGNICFGDSGGPSFATLGGHEVQVGVHSTGAGECGVQGHDTRVDLYADWIEEASGGDVAKDGVPSPAADNVPPFVNIDTPTEGSKVPQTFTVRATITDNIKVTQVDLVVDGQLEGSLTEPPWEFPLELSPGPHGLAVGALDANNNRGDHQVQFTVLAPAKFGDPCESPTFCESNLCAAHDAMPHSYCSQMCEPQGAACPDGAACYPAGDDKHVCGPPGELMSNNPDGGDSGGGGGCAAAGGANAWMMLWLLGLGWLLRRRRR